MTLAKELAPVGQRHMERDDEVSVARCIQRTAWRIVALDETRESHRGELPLGVRLVQAGPQRRSLRRVFADRERVEELQPRGLGEDLDEARGSLIRVIVGTLQQRRVAVEEIEVPVDHVVTIPR